MALHKMNDGCVGRALNEIRYADHIKKESVYTGYKDLDKVLGGMLPGELYLVGARPGMGKSCFTYNLLRRICVENGNPAVLFSPAASAESVIQKIIRMMSNIGSDFFTEREHSLKELEAYEQAADDIKKSSLCIEDSLNLTSEDFIIRCREIKNENPVRVVFLDSWKSIHFLPDTSEDDIIEIFQKIKSLACELEVTIVINMNLSRDIESRKDHYPEGYDFIIPAEALDEATGVMTLYREAYYGCVSVADESEIKESLEVHVFRSRKRSFQTEILLYRPYLQRIDDWNGEEFSEVRPLPDNAFETDDSRKDLMNVM